MPFRIDDNKLLVKYKTIWAKIEDLKNIELNALPVYEGRFIKTIIRTYGDKVYTNVCGFNVPEDGVECESFTVVSIGSWFFYENPMCCYLDNCAYKILGIQMTDYLDENLFEIDEN